LLASQGPERRKELRMEENSQDENSSLRDYWLKKRESKKESKRKRKKKEKTGKRNDKESEENIDQEGQGRAHVKGYSSTPRNSPLSPLATRAIRTAI
jgi:hypothetical protein